MWNRQKGLCLSKCGVLLITVLACPLFGQSAGIAVTTAVSTQLQGSSDALTATLTAAAPGPNITGTVTFYAGAASLGSAPVLAAAPGAGGVTSATATLMVAATAVGDSTVSASYGGDVNYAAGPPFVLTAAPAQNVTTIFGAQSGIFQLNLIPTNGFTGTVNLTCGQVPADLNCAVTPATVTIASTDPASIQAELSLACTPLFSSAPWSRLAWPWPTLACLLLGMAALALRRRRWSWIALAAALAVGSVACGGAPCTYTAGPGTAQVIATSGPATVKQGLTFFLPVIDPR